MEQEGTSPAGCSKSSDFSPAQPRRAKTRPSADKAAASCHLIRGGWDDPNCARRTSTFLSCAFREQGDRPSYPVPLFQHSARLNTEMLAWPQSHEPELHDA